MILRRCDQCHREIGEDALERFTLKRTGLIERYEDRGGPVDLCSLACVGAYAAGSSAAVEEWVAASRIPKL